MFLIDVYRIMQVKLRYSCSDIFLKDTGKQTSLISNKIRKNFNFKFSLHKTF